MESLEWHNRARGSIASGALTNSKRPESFIKGIYPTHVKRGDGAYLIDVSGKKYIDFICGLGTCLYGYSYDPLTNIGKQAEDMGCTLSLSSEHEVKLAEKIREYFSCIERLRFLKTGSEACTAAVTIARAYTKKNVILSDHYHGWNPEFISLTPPANGCPPSPYMRKLTNLSDITNEVAAVIIEPVVTDYSQTQKEYLIELRNVCTQKGVVLIFDETITALRFPGLSVAKYFGIEPDLMVFGKALGGGSSLACVGGKQRIMECDYFVSSTFAGEIGPINKAVKVLDLCKSIQPIETLWEFGEMFWRDFNKVTEGIVEYEGYPTRGILKGDDLKKGLFMQECCKAGILFGASPFLMFPHIKLKQQILTVVKDVALKIRTNGAKLEGELPKKPYAQQVREGVKT